MNEFFVGQDVVCIDSSNQHDQPISFFNSEVGWIIKENQVYKIRWIGMQIHPILGTELCVRLEGIIRPYCKWTNIDDIAFRTNRFRPVVNKQLPESITRYLTQPYKEYVE